MITLCPVCRKKECHPVSGWTPIAKYRYYQLFVDHRFQVDLTACPSCKDNDRQTAIKTVKPSFVQVEFAKFVY